MLSGRQRLSTSQVSLACPIKAFCRVSRKNLTENITDNHHKFLDLESNAGDCPMKWPPRGGSTLIKCMVLCCRNERSPVPGCERVRIPPLLCPGHSGSQTVQTEHRHAGK